MNEVEAAFLIADLAGYTALTETHGDTRAASVLARYVEITEHALEPGARLVERVGDEVLIVAAEARTAVATAVRLRAAIEREPLFPTVRIGMHAGSIVEQNGKYFGAALNLTARVATHASEGQILCTDRVATQAASVDGVEYRALGQVRFKNIVEPVALFEIFIARQSRETIVLDPVCRMQVKPDSAPARLPYGGSVYHFCSVECARAFAARPDDYVSR